MLNFLIINLDHSKVGEDYQFHITVMMLIIIITYIGLGKMIFSKNKFYNYFLTSEV